MKSKQNVMERFKFLFPEFLREDYSPYKCRVSSNRENYDLRARRIHLQNMVKTWINTGKNPFCRPVECKDCLFDTRIPNIYIGPDGLCNMCMTYKQNFKPEVLTSELETFMNTPREEGAGLDAVVAFSGGKDSTVSLYLAREKYKLDVVPVLVDNDFIPRSVIEKGRDFCQEMGAELVVLHIDFVPRVKEMMDKEFKSGYPCYLCTAMFHEEIQKYCVENRINRVILGRNWWRWLEPEVRAVRWVKDERSGLDIQFLSLPFALRLTENSVRALLKEIGWSPVEIHGNSTNCLIPGLVEYTMYKRLGYHPELNLLSREVISGYLDKERAKEELKHIEDLTPDLRRIVSERLEARQTSNSSRGDLYQAGSR
jgi:tRNA(Ile)-lysidine synthase TilS/MesJ